MPTYQLPNDDPPKSLPTLTKEQKQKGIIALQESLNRSMGYTIENKKIVIWTSKVAEPWDYPFQDEVTNYTYFYKNLYSKEHFLKLPAANIEEVKLQEVSKALLLKMGTFILKSKKSHFKQRKK